MNVAASPGRSPWRLVPLAAFFLLILGPAGGWLGRISPPADFQEMRTLAAWPAWRSATWASWPAAFEAWLNDHYPLRARLIIANGYLRHRILGAPSNFVIVGRQGWLFYSGNNTVEDMVGRDRLTDDELKRWADALEGRRDWLRARGVAYLYVLVPNKSTIYPEELPPLLRAQMRPGKLDQLVDYLRAHSTVPVLDLRPALLEEKARRVDYWKTDTHWNGYGHVAAYCAIMEQLRQMGVAQRAPDDLRWIDVSPGEHFGDLVDLLAMRDHWPRPLEPVLRLRRPPDLRDSPSALSGDPAWKDRPDWQAAVTTERDSGRGRAVLLCDSFFRVGGVASGAEAQTPFMLSFHRFASIWCWPNFQMISSIVKKEHPDVIIEQQTERFLKQVIPADDPEFVRARSAAK